MQKFLEKLGLAVPSMVLALTTLAVVPAVADHGSGDNTSGGSTTSSETEHNGTTVATTTSTETETETETDSSNTTELHKKGLEMVSELQKEHKSNKTAAQKQQICEARKHGLETKFSRITTNATNLETKIGTFQDRAVTYQSDNKVTVADWDTLVQNATDAKTKVDASLTALKEVTPTVDCTSGTVASDIATFKTAAQTVRDDLKSYKTAVMKLFTALQNAKEDSKTSTTEGSTN